MQAIKQLDNTECASTHSLSALLKAGGDHLRLQILRVLTRDSFGVLELSHIFATKQSGMSHHLKVLANAGLVSTRREGNSIFYHRSNPLAHEEFVGVREALASAVSTLAFSEEVQGRINEIHQQRSQTSHTFFSENGSSLKEKQDLIANFDVYGSQVESFLQHRKETGGGRALEIGPGEGEFLPILASRFREVIALDNSQTMLERSRKFCLDQKIDNVEFHLADTQYCAMHNNNFNTIVINMVLHHTPSPQQIFADVSPALEADGALIVCELCHHDQDWTRQACGDLWLGFEPEELTHWAAEKNLSEGQSDYFALRNGFQIQIREFLKNTDS